MWDGGVDLLTSSGHLVWDDGVMAWPSQGDQL